jgi:hypothetical protein
MCTQFNIFVALPRPSPPELRHLNRHKIEISTIHRSARKTGSSELWRNLHVKNRSAAFGSKYAMLLNFPAHVKQCVVAGNQLEVVGFRLTN